MGYPDDATFEAARENRAPPAQRRKAVDTKESKASVPSMVYVVCCRPYPEKVVGGAIFTNGPRFTRCDGTFFMDYEGARGVAMTLNRRDGPGNPCWMVYPALISVNPACADCGGAMAQGRGGARPGAVPPGASVFTDDQLRQDAGAVHHVLRQ